MSPFYTHLENRLMKQITSRTMRAVLQASVGVFLVAGCAGDVDSSTGPTAVIKTPDAVVQSSKMGDATSTGKGSQKGPTLTTSGVVADGFVTVLGRAVPLRSHFTVGAAIGPAGGTITIPEIGFTLVVPKGAVRGVVKFSVTAMAGASVAYDFAPHGIKFKVPLQFRQSLTVTTALPGMALMGGYFKDKKQVDSDAMKAKVDESTSTRLENGSVVFDLWHFSGYLVSMA